MKHTVIFMSLSLLSYQAIQASCCSFSIRNSAGRPVTITVFGVIKKLIGKNIEEKYTPSSDGTVGYGEGILKIDLADLEDKSFQEELKNQRAIKVDTGTRVSEITYFVVEDKSTGERVATNATDIAKEFDRAQGKGKAKTSIGFIKENWNFEVNPDLQVTTRHCWTPKDATKTKKSTASGASKGRRITPKKKKGIIQKIMSKTPSSIDEAQESPERYLDFIKGKKENWEKLGLKGANATTAERDEAYESIRQALLSNGDQEDSDTYLALQELKDAYDELCISAEEQIAAHWQKSDAEIFAERAAQLKEKVKAGRR